MSFTISTYAKDFFAEKTYATGLLTGVVVGLAAGLLLAPRSGKAMRKRIAGAVDDKTEDVESDWSKTREKATDIVNHLKGDAGSLVNKAQDEFAVYAEKAEDKAHQLADDARDRIDKAKDAIN